jgi:hypothetical protein
MHACIITVQWGSAATEKTTEWFLESLQEKIMFMLSRHLRSNIITVHSYETSRKSDINYIPTENTWQ